MSTFFFCLAMSDICNIFKSQCQHKITLLLHNILHEDFFICYELQFCCMKYLLNILYFQFLFASAPARTRLGDRNIAIHFKTDGTKKVISKHKFLLDLFWGEGGDARGFLHHIFFKDNILEKSLLVPVLPFSQSLSYANEEENSVMSQ